MQKGMIILLVVIALFAERLREVRKKHGLKQLDIVNITGCSIDSVRRWEQNKQYPRCDELQKIATALNTSVAYLMGETDDPSQIPTFTRDALPACADIEQEHKAAKLPTVSMRTPAKIIESIAAINGELETASGFFTDAEAVAAETLLNLCLKNFETEHEATKEQETA